MREVGALTTPREHATQGEMGIVRGRVWIVCASLAAPLPALAQAQLAITQINAPPSVVEGWLAPPVVVTVTNIGTVDLQPSFSLWISGSTVTTPSLPPGASINASIDVSRPVGYCDVTQPWNGGSWCDMSIVIQVGEQDPGTASLHDEEVVMIAVLRQWPDITGAIVSAPTQATVGESFIVHAIVSNIGFGTMNTPSLNSTLRFMGVRGTNHDEWFEGWLPDVGPGLPGILAGQTRPLTATVTIPASAVPGSYRLGIEVGLPRDIQTLAIDRNYANNYDYAGPTLVVLARPDGGVGDSGVVDVGVATDAEADAATPDVAATSAPEAAPTSEDAAEVHADAAPTIEDAAPTIEDAAPAVEDAGPPMFADASDPAPDAAPALADAAPEHDAAPAPADATTSPRDATAIGADAASADAASAGGDAASSGGGAVGCTGTTPRSDTSHVLAWVSALAVLAARHRSSRR